MTAIKKAESAKSSAAPAQPPKTELVVPLSVVEDVFDDVLWLERQRWGKKASDPIQTKLRGVIARLGAAISNATTPPKPAHQALYEALSAARDAFDNDAHSGKNFFNGENSAIARIRAALALADAAKEQG